jgi:Xaa-Pro dipeptidase
VDLAVIVGNADLFYLAGTIQQAHLLLPAQGEPLLLVRKDPDRARRESALPQVEPLAGLRELPAALGRLAVDPAGTLALELDILPVEIFRRYQTMWPEATFVDCGLLLREVRSVKSAFELERLRAGADLADAVVREAAGALRAGMTELELSAHLEGFARGHGHQGLIRMRAFNQEMVMAHVYSGPDAGMASYLDGPFAGRGLTPAMPQGSSLRPIRPGDPVVLDFGAAVDGYVVDQTRTLSLGPVAPELAEGYAACLKIQELVAAGARPGVAAGQVYAQALAEAERRGLADRFMGARPHQVSFVGHGVGIEIDELPVLARGVETPLRQGHVVACEPKLRFPGVGAVGVENTWVVGREGLERISYCPQDIWEV